MKYRIKKMLYFVACLHSITMMADSNVISYYNMRSQSTDAARELAGWTQHVNLADACELYGTFALTTEYARSFRPQQIAQCLFGSTACQEIGQCLFDTGLLGDTCQAATIEVSGSRTDNRGANDWLADYFYLPTDFKSTLEFTPRIENVVVDMNMHLGLDEWLSGLFFRAHAPIVWTRWDLHFCESVIEGGINNDEAGYFSPAPIGRSLLLNNFAEFARGQTVTGVPNAVFNGLQFAKFDHCSHSKMGLAEIQMVLGYNFLLTPDYHVGLGLRACAPTGTQPEGVLLFEPIVGNGKHWELGANLTAHTTLWHSYDDRTLGFYVDANITHLFSTSQRRTFDVSCKPLSRYMTAEKLGLPITDNLNGNVQAPSAQFLQEFTPIANISNRKVKVSIGVQADIAAQLTYASNGFAWDVGYNFFGRSCEKFSRPCRPDCSDPAFVENTWAIKGDAYVWGFNDNTNAPVALSATQSLATINSGKNFPAIGTTDTITEIPQDRRNPNIDQPTSAFSALVPLTATIGGAAPADETKTSVEPVFIHELDINYVGSRATSNKIYMNLSYSWLECSEYKPYVGIGGFGEFGSHGDCNSCCGQGDLDNDQCQGCVLCSLAQWGFWIKGGISF